MKKRGATITEVAREAGVSIGTVSHVINETARVRPATRTKVENAIRNLAYSASFIDRSCRSIFEAHSSRDPSLKHPRLVSVGYISVDYTARVEVMPHREDRVSAQHIEKSLGGPAANVAVSAASLGSPFEIEVDLATALGDDADSQWALAQLAFKGVRALPIRAPFNERLSRCFILVEANGCRTIINEPFQLEETDLPVAMASETPDRPRCLHLEGYHVERMAGSLPAFRQQGWRLSLQTIGLPATSRNRRSFCALLATFDILFVNADLAREILGCRATPAAMGEALSALLRTVPRTGIVVLTLGEHGAMVFDVGDCDGFSVAALPVDVVDSTGAGDAFCGAFLGVWLKTNDVSMATRYGTIAGGLAVTAEGAQGRPTSAREMEQFRPVPDWSSAARPAIVELSGANP